MKTLNIRSSWSTANLLIYVCIALLGGTGGAMAQTVAPSQGTKADQEIHITADKLETFNDKNLARFSGNVRATQADTVITCAQLDIYYERQNKTNESDTNPKTKPQSPPTEKSQGSLKRVVAIHDVKIRSGDRVASSEQAEYTAETGVIVLTGENAKVTSGNNTVSGNKITMFRNDERMIVESGEKKRVEAVVYSGDQKLMQ